MPGVRTRFAPSPTGSLHVGGVRTALFNHLLARNTGGVFVLRIEDTDRERSEERYATEIQEALQWLGLDWDEGPFRQSERSELYENAVTRLLESGAAYRCTCSPEELEARRAAGERAGYDRHCRPGVGPGPAEGKRSSVRFATPLDGTVVIDDRIRGRIEFQTSEIEDFVIARSDGSPTYQLVVTVDDADMRISDVVRGDDLLNSSPKQVLLYRALGVEPPAFAHLPQVLGADKTRLSKRHGAAAVLEYRELGYYPDALVNFLARLGWAHGDQEVFTRTELIHAFSLENVGKSAGVFNAEKLDWLNGLYLRARSLAELAGDLREFAGRRRESLPGDAAWQERMVGTLRERAQTLGQLHDAARFYLEDEIVLDEDAARKHLTPASADLLEGLVAPLATLDSWSEADLEATFRAVAERAGQKLGALAQPARVALTGRTTSPGIFEVLAVLGRERSLERLGRAIARAR